MKEATIRTPPSIPQLRAAADSLVLYANLLSDPIGQAFIRLLRAISRNSPQALPCWRRLSAQLAREAELYPGPMVGDWLQNHILDRILDSENAFSQKAELAPFEAISRATRQMAGADLEAIERLAAPLALPLLRACLSPRSRQARQAFTTSGLCPWPEAGPVLSETPRVAMKQRLLDTLGWATLLPDLAAYYRQHGAGLFGRFCAFRWTGEAGEPRLEGIPAPDPIVLDELFAYDAERALLLQNTEQFVAGFPANNVLIYGDRGTGKSSTIKALLHSYVDRRLRLVELPKSRLRDFPRLMRLLRGRPERFVLFIDDLSFEEYETDYKEMKALLEGGLEARPQNVVLYATSNRRHLITERFSDRRHAEPGDEIHSRDTAEEKLSLSDRFGITLTFVAPDQPRYLQIVRGLAARRRLSLPDQDLCERALLWAQKHNGRSGRSARQFVDFLEAELALQGESAPK